LALFSKKSKTKASDEIVLSQEDEILGYLDEVFRSRVSLQLAFKKRITSTEVLFIDLKNKALRVQMSEFGGLKHGEEALAGFSLDKTWWSFQTKLLFDQDKPHLLIPKLIRHAERRKTPRTAFTPREQVKVTIMEGIGSGHGVFGIAKDISRDGMAITVERAMNLSTEKETPVNSALFKPGSKLSFIKINRIPGCPMIEVQGIARRLQKDGKWVFAISFHKLSNAHATMITRFIEPRVLDFRYVKRSLKEREERESNLLASPRNMGANEKAISPEPQPKKVEEPDESQPAAAPDDSPASAELPEDVQADVLVVGEELRSEFQFLVDNGLVLRTVDTPVSIAKALSQDKPKALLCGLEFKGREIVELLERIASMGLLDACQTIVCAADIPLRDRIKLKMLNVQEFQNLPVEDRAAFVNKLNG